MFSSLARLNSVMKIQTALLRNLQYAVSQTMPEVINIKNKIAVRRAAKYLLSGQIIAVPTDTIYGIAASGEHFKAVHKLYEIKRRDITKPVAICVNRISDIHLWGEANHLSEEMLNSLLPGAVTVVLKRKPALSPYINPNTELVGIRVPDYPFMTELIRLCKTPIVLTSANLSSEPSALEVSEFSHLWPQLAAVFDGGPLGSTFSSRAGSTVVDLSETGFFTILRAGIAFERTLSVLKEFNLKEKF